MTVTQEGKVQFLKQLLAGATIALTIRLAQDPWPAVVEKLVTNAALTEATFGGYAPVSPGTWPTPVINGSDESESDAALLTWTSAGVGAPQNVVGLYLTFVGAGPVTYCLAAHKFAAPITIAVDGELIEKQLNAYLANLVP